MYNAQQGYCRINTVTLVAPNAFIAVVEADNFTEAEKHPMFKEWFPYTLLSNVGNVYTFSVAPRVHPPKSNFSNS